MKRNRADRLGTISPFATVWTGSSWAFAMALAIIVVWSATGPIFDYSDTWQLIINTGTTIVTYLMVFLIQRSQNKDSLAIQLKLNEIVAALEKRQQWLDLMPRTSAKRKSGHCTITTCSPCNLDQALRELDRISFD